MPAQSPLECHAAKARWHLQIARREMADLMNAVYGQDEHSEVHIRILRWEVFPEAIAAQLHTLARGRIRRCTVVQETYTGHG